MRSEKEQIDAVEANAVYVGGRSQVEHSIQVDGRL